MSLYRMPFGKYKGTLIHDLPDEYLEWLNSLDDLREPLAGHVFEEYERRTTSFTITTAKIDHYTLMMAEEMVSSGHKALALRHHPDRGGETATMQAVNAAASWLRQAILQAKKGV